MKMKMNHIHNYNYMNENECVLLVSPKLTKEIYRLLVACCPSSTDSTNHDDNNDDVSLSIVARNWHLDGRYGSRTHQFYIKNNNNNNNNNNINDSSDHNDLEDNVMIPLSSLIQQQILPLNDSSSITPLLPTKTTIINEEETTSIKTTSIKTNHNDEKKLLYIGIPIRSIEILLEYLKDVDTSHNEDNNNNNNNNNSIPNATTTPCCHEKQNYHEKSNNDSIELNSNTTATYTSKIVDHTNDNNNNDLSLAMKKKTKMKKNTVIKTIIDSHHNPQHLLSLFIKKNHHNMYMIHKLYQPTNRKLISPPFDATIHPERKPILLVNDMSSSSSSIPLNTTINIITNQSSSSSNYSFTYIELFTGIGGFGIALDALGGKCILACEIDNDARATYIHNFPQYKDILFHNIYDISNDVISNEVDILVGGFPCQPFSSLGQQPGFNDERSGLLFYEILRFIQYCSPKSFLLENVPGLLTMTDTYNTIIVALQKEGYAITTEIINSRGLTAQCRKRLYIVGIRNNNTTNNNDMNTKSDMGQGEQTTNKVFEFPYIPDLNLRGIDVITYETNMNSPHDTIDNISKSLLYINNIQLNKLNDERYWKSSKLLWPNNTSNTLVSHYGVSIARGHSQLIPTYHNPRKLTPTECLRIMGFPYKRYHLIPLLYNHNNDSNKIHNHHIINHTVGTQSHQRKKQKKSNSNSQDSDHDDIDNDHDDDDDIDNNDRIPLSNERIMMGHIKRQYKMIGNAVCPPIIASIIGSIIHCCPTIIGYNHHTNWIEYGRYIAIQLAYEATLTHNKNENS